MGEVVYLLKFNCVGGLFTLRAGGSSVGLINLCDDHLRIP